MRGVNFQQKDTWTFEDVRLIREAPSGNKTKEGTYYGLRFGENTIIWLSRKVGNNIDDILKDRYINLKEIKEETIYDFNCTCAEGVESYIRHGTGRCDGCHGRIFK